MELTWHRKQDPADKYYKGKYDEYIKRLEEGEQRHGQTCYDIFNMIAFDKKTFIEIETSYSFKTAEYEIANVEQR
jgi:hypothetical protein